MALKDWKKVIQSKNTIFYYKEKPYTNLKIEKHNNEYYIEGNKVGALTGKGPFKTKTQALAYAKKYMRSHS